MNYVTLGQLKIDWNMKQKKKKEGKGGAREGAGRPNGEPTTVIRVPVSKLPAIRKLLKKAA
jgi:hypothetical protein